MDEMVSPVTVSPIRVLIVQPWFSNDPTKTRLQSAECLALGYLTSVLRRAGIEVDTLDAHLLGLTNLTFHGPRSR
jgi:hypothetical protein